MGSRDRDRMGTEMEAADRDGDSEWVLGTGTGEGQGMGTEVVAVDGDEDSRWVLATGTGERAQLHPP